MVETGENERWVLAFDAACSTCDEIARAAEAAAGGRLQVLPLKDSQVERWRATAFGAEPPFGPTLLRIRHNGQQVRGWTGRQLVAPLVGRLGMSRTIRVLDALGQLQARVRQPLQATTRPVGVSRAQFLRWGAMLAGGVVLGGAAPAFAAERATAAKNWVAANRNNLPRTYGEFSRYQLAFRKEIFRKLPVSTRATLWREHILRYRAEHKSLTAAQHKALAALDNFIATDSVFDPNTPNQDTKALKSHITAAFGAPETAHLLSSLGSPASPADRIPDPDCNCCKHDDYCNGPSYCAPRGCVWDDSGCGTFWQEECDGMCA
ncbi:bacteriocin fulvocin C-related protein [Kribbella sp. NPDC056951]|uniref:bacteriocin fulvocin C-related protein n=1 Tax=Kribbella sp. NPDC056951 TaxID=3345978 RepID=UPI00362E6A91